MSRSPRRALVATAIATTLFVAAPASASPPPKSLTNRFPLGTQTLCCQSQSATTSGTATQGVQTIIPPAGQLAMPTATATAPSAHRHSGDGTSLLLIVVALALALLLVLVPWPTAILARTAKLAGSTRRTVARLHRNTTARTTKLARSTRHTVERFHRSTPPVQPQLHDPWRRTASGSVRYENPSEAGRMTRPWRLPQSGNRLFLTDSGLETTLIFDEGIELPHFAAFTLLDSADGRRRLREYFTDHLRVARAAEAGFVAESPTWRASPDWGERLGYDPDRLAAANRRAVKLLAELRDETGVSGQEFVISGCIGPRGDGHPSGVQLSPDAAEAYHEWQIDALADAPIDLVSALGITSVGEAIGITRAALRRRLPVVISFTTETDGRLPTGHTLERAIRAVDIETRYGPDYYMINCAHPSHFGPALATVGPDVIRRLHGIQASTSRRSHAELDGLDGLDGLDREDPEQLPDEYRLLTEQFPRLTVLGGCYGTDLRHIEAIAAACNRPVAHRV